MLTSAMSFAGVDGGIVLPFRRTWQGMVAQGHDAAHRQGNNPVTLSRKNTLADNNWVTFKRFWLRIAKNTFDYGFYNLDETGAPSSSP